MDNNRSNKLLTYILSQYANRPHGSINQNMALAHFRGELQKVCDDVIEETYRICPYLSNKKYVIISFFFIALTVVGLLSSIATLIVALVGMFLYWLIFDMQFSFIEKIFPAKKVGNVYGMMYGSEHNKTSLEQTILFVSHIDDVKNDFGVVRHLIALFVHWSVYVITLVTVIGYFVGVGTGNYVVIPFVSIIATILLFFSMSLYIDSPTNKVSGVATAVCLMDLANSLSYEGTRLMDSTNIGFLITSSMNERHEGIKSFIQSHSNDTNINPASTTIVCLEELNDSETLCCYRSEGFRFTKYSETVINTLKDAAEAEDVPLLSTINRVHKPFTHATTFLDNKFKEVVPITAKTRGLKRKSREEEERKVKKEKNTVCIHEDQFKCIEDTTKVLLRYCKIDDASRSPLRQPVFLKEIEDSPIEL
ncbi:Uncharacterized protein QTN25_005873 [Entamoeba marina]